MASILRDGRTHWCPQCKKQVRLEVHMMEDLCENCRLVVKYREKEDFEEVSDEEYERREREAQLKNQLPEA
jgi:hypothetical protein